MDRDSFIAAVFLTVCNQYDFIKQNCKMRRGDFAPALSDEEVITMETCGEYFKIDCDKDIFACFKSHCRHFFPKLSDRSSFVRQAANSWQVKSAVQKRLAMISGETNDPVQSVDTVPLPVCVIARARRDRCFQGEADFGCRAAKDMHCYGFKLGLRVSKFGMITHYSILPARPHDMQSLETLLEGFEVTAPADSSCGQRLY